MTDTCHRCELAPAEGFTVDMSPPAPVCGTCSDVLSGYYAATRDIATWRRRMMTTIHAN
jgi:hypothetical protein